MSNQELPYGYIYRITNKVNGKTYIGQRKLALDKSWRQYMGSGVAIKDAIKKYGAENFTKEIIEYQWSEVLICLREAELILDAWANGAGEYNISITPITKFTVSINDYEEREKAALAISEIYLSFKNKEGIKTKKRIKSKKWESKYLEFKKVNEDLILREYAIKQSFNKVAEDNSLSRKWVARVLKENSIELNHRNKVGVKHSQETLIKLKAARKAQLESLPDEMKKSPYEKECANKRCKSNFTTLKASQQFCSDSCSRSSRSHAIDIPEDRVYELYTNQGLTILEVAKILNVGRGPLYNRIKELGLQRYKKL